MGKRSNSSNHFLLLSLTFEDITTPAWSGRPFRLMPSDMYEVEWGFFVTQIRSYISFAELCRSIDDSMVTETAEEVLSEEGIESGPEVV